MHSYLNHNLVITFYRQTDMLIDRQFNSHIHTYINRHKVDYYNQSYTYIDKKNTVKMGINKYGK